MTEPSVNELAAVPKFTQYRLLASTARAVGSSCPVARTSGFPPESTVPVLLLDPEPLPDAVPVPEALLDAELLPASETPTDAVLLPPWELLLEPETLRDADPELERLLKLELEAIPASRPAALLLLVPASDPLWLVVPSRLPPSAPDGDTLPLEPPQLAIVPTAKNEVTTAASTCFMAMTPSGSSRAPMLRDGKRRRHGRNLRRGSCARRAQAGRRA